MFKRVLVANRGEIAVRVVRACRDLGIWVIALYDASDRGSLHVRLADECVELKSPLGYLDPEEIIHIAQQTGAEAIHPGYAFLSERAAFAAACEKAGIVFIGPPSEVIAATQDKIAALKRVRQAGLATPLHSTTSFDVGDFAALRAEADALGYPLIVKPCFGGRGRAARMVRAPQQLEEMVRQAHAEAQLVYGNSRLYLERAILPAYYLDLQIVADNYGNLLYLGERHGSLQRRNQKLIVESPASCLTDVQRQQVREIALKVARLFQYRNVGTIELLMDANGRFYFTEVKARIQVEHPVTEMVSRVDLVREQIEIAAGGRLRMREEDSRPAGWAMSCRINAEDPWNHFLPSPGHLRRFRLPGGPYVRVDTYAYSGCDVPTRYDPLLAKVIVWGEDRHECLMRMRRTLQDFAISGVRTNLPFLQRILDDPDFVSGHYDVEFLRRPLLRDPSPATDLRDLAIAAAVAYVSRYQAPRPVVPERFRQGWHRSARSLA